MNERSFAMVDSTAIDCRTVKAAYRPCGHVVRVDGWEGIMVVVGDRAGRLASIVFMVLWTAGAAGADLGPRKPSEVVDVALTLGSAACTNTGMKFDTVLAPDGTQTPFAIPEKRVLVVTAIELLGFGAPPGAGVQTRIFRGVGQSVNNVAIRESAADATGRIFHVYQFDPGVVVASGGEVCTNNNLGITTTGTLRGYLAKDK